MVRVFSYPPLPVVCPRRADAGSLSIALLAQRRENRKLSGTLLISIKGARDLDHLPVRVGTKKRETYVTVRNDKEVIAHTSLSRADAWGENFEIPMASVHEIEFVIHDNLSSVLRSSEKAPVGLVWIRLSDVVDEQRRLKNARLQKLMNQGGHAGGAGAGLGDMASLGNTLEAEPITAQFTVEPEGALELTVNFIKSNVAKNPYGPDLGRKGAVRKRGTANETVTVMGHQFVSTQFYTLIRCAVCGGNLIKDGFKCDNCMFACHRRCLEDVFTKCVSRTVQDDGQSDGGDILDKYKIPHRFEAFTNIGTNWCYHCGHMLPIGRRSARKCSECSVTAHTDCTDRIPHICGINPEMIRALKAARPQAPRPRPQRPEKPLPPPQTFTPSVPAPGPTQAARPAPPSSVVAKPPTPTGSTSDQRVPYHQPTFQPEPPSGYDDRTRYEQSPASHSSPLSYSSPPSGRIHPHGPQQMPPTSTVALPPASQTPSTLPEPAPYNRVPVPAAAADPRLAVAQPAPAPVSDLSAGLDMPGPTGKPVTLQDFNFLSVLGKGNFGKVMLAEERATGELVAIKVLKKAFCIENDEIESLRSEKRVFLAASREKHPFLLTLHSCFQTETRIYFVMEYISGGDLMLHIQTERFSRQRTKFYAAEVLLALEYFHSQGIVYRDLKLDNIMLTLDGHVKVADYGLCKESMWAGATTNTFCGTPEFMAPEILLEQPYTRAVDWWAFGILLYEMILGQAPFRGDDEDEIFDAILEDEPLFPLQMPPHSVPLLMALLQRDPKKRLGAGAGDAAEIKRHPYFADIDWDALYAKRIEPPFKPTLKSKTDTSWFDTEFTSERPTLTPVNSVLSPADQNEFADFDWPAGAQR